jgi:DNA-binding MarR family transcriptional regulator
MYKPLAQVTCINQGAGMSPRRAKVPVADPLAVRLAVAIKRLRGRFREAAWAGGVELPIAHVAVIKRLRNEGPTTASALAAAEHVTHQAITQTLAALKREGLVSSAPDPSDGRKSVISVTPAGNRLFESAIASRDAWLARAIESVISPRERAALEKSIELLERLADAGSPEP